MGYELRRKGRKVEKHNVVGIGGEILRTAYMPHLAITPSTLARTWKMLKEAAKLFGYVGKPYGCVWAEVLLLAWSISCAGCATKLTTRKCRWQSSGWFAPCRKTSI